MDDLLDTAPCGYFSFDDEGEIVHANRTLSEMLGRPVSALAGRRIDEILTVASRIFYQTHFFPLIRVQGKAEEIYLQFRTEGGEELPALVNAVRREDGGAFLNHCVLIPVHNRRKYEDEILKAKRAAEHALQSNEALVATKNELERHARELDRQIELLEQRNRELTRVGQMLAHDLREPIRRISWFAELVREESAEAMAPASLQLLEKIGEASRSADRLMQSLRTFLAIEATDHDPEEVPLDEVVTLALEEVRERTGIGGIRVEREGLPSVVGVRRQLVLLFRSLMENTVSCSRGEAAPWIVLGGDIVRENSYRALPGRYRYADYARIIYRDGGNELGARCGQVTEDHWTSADGFRSGLAISRKVVDAHRGAISLEQESGTGRRFTILLPRSAQ